MVTKQKGVVIGILIALYLIILLLFYGLSESLLSLVFLGTLPIFIHVVILSIRIWQGGELLYMWILPFVLSLIFFVVHASGVVSPFDAMDGHSLVLWQLICNFALNFIAIFLLGTMNSGLKNAFASRQSHSEHHSSNHANLHNSNQHSSHQHTSHSPEQIAQAYRQQNMYVQQQLMEQQKHLDYLRTQVAQTQNFREQAEQYLRENAEFKRHIKQLEQELTFTKQKLDISRQNVDVTLREIEAKAKALNFVVGRVYSEKNGGSPQIREKLNIPRELYNKFSQITTDYSSNDAKELLEILTVIRNKLTLYELPEKTVFTLGDGGERLLRDSSGSTAILEVLSNNDSDPVVEYYTGAKEICDKLIAFLKKQ
jgi:hypothetical protein